MNKKGATFAFETLVKILLIIIAVILLIMISMYLKDRIGSYISWFK